MNVNILKLDILINGKEYFVGDAEATEHGFKMLTTSNWISSDVEKEIWTEGCAAPDLSDADVRELFAEIADIDAAEIEEVHFVMCLWQEDEVGEQTHLESCYTLSKVAEL